MFKRLFGDSNERYLNKIRPLVDKINSLEQQFEKLSDGELKGKTSEFKKRLEKETLDDLLPEAFALVREASKRTLNQRHYDVQLLGGIVLHQGKIAEMKTGEGKTLVATLPAYLNALKGKGVHIVTVNDYLAKRDTVWMGQIYHLLGLKTACIVHDASYLYDPEFAKENKELDEERDRVASFKVIEDFLRPISRKEAYAADITYGTNNEFGFDYLRDNLVVKTEDVVQRELNYAIIDEVDSILIDEARTPLIISMPDTESMGYYKEFARIIPLLKENEDYNVDEKYKAVTLTEEGIKKIEKILGIDNIYDEKGFKYLHFLEQALKAEILFKRDRDYIVKNGEVIIVDEFTGRLLPGRRYSGGLHQAIEAKEGVRIQPESRTLASISFQNYFRMYKKLAGMTGTALTSAEEFDKVYNLEVIVIPTNKPMIRKDLPDRIYKTNRAKLKAVVKEVKKRHQKGQPVLIGTVSIEKNEFLSKLLEREGIPHQVLNAKNHEREGEIIAQAGRLGAVTVATNIAGRGVDIILGGNPPDPEESKKVKELGGLYIIGTERHEARRIDNQLRGRAGRQGDPGSTQFFLSLEDDLLRIFGGDQIRALLERFDFPEEEPIENKMLSNIIESAQSKIEAMNFETRKHLLEYDDVLNKHREIFYKKRRAILENKNLGEEILGFLKREIERIVEFHCQGINPQSWNVEEIVEEMRTIFPVPQALHSRLNGFVKKQTREETIRKIKDFLFNLVEKAYHEKEKELGVEQMRELEKLVLLQCLDFNWMNHLENMEYLRDAVRLRAYGQRDPLVEYKKEGYLMFQDLLTNVERQVARTIFKVVPIEKKEEAVKTVHLGQKKKVGRNDPCPCGSGKKYKKCCWPKYG